MSPNVSRLPVPGDSRRPAPLEGPALEALCEAVESGAGIIELVRAAAAALDASLVLVDRAGAVLAVAARSPAEERALVDSARDVTSLELRVADEVVGQLRLRPRGAAPPAPALVRTASAMLALEIARVRAPDRAAGEAAAALVLDVLRRELTGREEILERAGELGVDLGSGGVVVVARAHPVAPVDDDWRARLLTVAARAARSTAPGTLAAQSDGEDGPVGGAVLVVPEPSEDAARRVGAAVLRELEGSLTGLRLAVGLSRVAADPVDLHRAANEALLAANVAEGDGGHLLAFEETGAYRLLLPAMSENPDELQRFFAETLEPVIAYDEQYETDLVQTLETYLDSDGNVAGTASKLFTHRHTVRYRLERVRELSGHDVSSSDGREKLSLGLKAMRVLGIAPPRGPATEAGAEAGRVPRESQDRS